MALASPRKTTKAFPAVPLEFTDGEEWMRRATITLNNVLQGRTNNAGTAILGAGTTTVISNANVASVSTIQLTPKDTTATVWYVSAVADGNFTITHDTGGSGGEFFYAIHG